MAAKKTVASKSARKPVTKGAAQPAVPTLARTLKLTDRKKAGLPNISPEKRLAAARSVAHKINEDFKSQVVVPANEAHSNYFLRRPSGIMQLDIDTGGGLPAASFNTITGPDNAGKSTLLYCYFAMHQFLYGNDAYTALLSSESTIDYPQARRCGWVVPYPEHVIANMNEARLRDGLPPLSPEELAYLRQQVGQNYIVTGLSTAEEMLDVARQLLETNLYGIVGLDSLEGLMPNSEAKLDTLEEFPGQGGRATAITRFLQHYGPVARDAQHFTTFIATCQVRVNRKKFEAPPPMQKYIKDWAGSVPGAVKHWREIDLTIWSGEKQRKAEQGKESKTVVGKDMNWELSKGKMGTHDNIHGGTTYWYDDRCFDIQRTVLIAGLKYGVVSEHDGLLTFTKNGAPHEYLCRIAGPDQFVQALKEDPGVEMELRYAILRAAGKECLYV